MSDRHIGIALFHRLGFDDLKSRVGGPLLALLGTASTSALELRLGDESLGLATEQAIAAVTKAELSRGADRALTVQTADRSALVELSDPQRDRPRAITPSSMSLVLKSEDLDRKAFLKLCEAVDVRYGFVTVTDSFETAYDEVFWPDAQHLKASSEARRHSNAWLQMIRSFGRHQLGVGIPDIYWLNVFGFQLINELRRLHSWDELEGLVPLRFLESGAVYFTTSDLPATVDSDALSSLACRIANACAPLGLMHRALVQARQGDRLVLDSLAATADRRLLLGLAFADGLEAFRQLAGPTASAVETVQQALNFLDEHASDRPRCYGEAPPEYHDDDTILGLDVVEESEETAAEGKSMSVDADEQVPELTPEQLAEDPVEASATWNIRWNAWGSVRREVPSIRWSEVADPTHRALSVSLVNALPADVQLVLVRAACLVDEQVVAVHEVASPSLNLAPMSGRTRIELEVDAPLTGRRLVLSAGLRYVLEDAVADILVENGVARVLGAPIGTLVAKAWPAEISIQPHHDELLVRVSNTTQEPWRGWVVSLRESEADVGYARYEGSGVLPSGATTYAKLPLRKGMRDGHVQVWLEAEACVDVTLAEFEP